MNLNQYSESSAQPGLSVKKLLELEYPIPKNKEEQAAIAEALSNIDSLISALQKLIEKKKSIKQGALQELLTGKNSVSPWIIPRIMASKKLMVILIYCLFVCFSYIKILLYHKNTGDTISRLSFRMKI